jgi:hypothetical protein
MNALNSAQTLHLGVVKEVNRLLLPGSFTSFQVTERNQALDSSYLMLNHDLIVPYTFPKLNNLQAQFFGLNAASPKW